MGRKEGFFKEEENREEILFFFNGMNFQGSPIINQAEKNCGAWKNVTAKKKQIG